MEVSDTISIFDNFDGLEDSGGENVRVPLLQVTDSSFKVTGGNKGIGYAIVRGLCEQSSGIVNSVFLNLSPAIGPLDAVIAPLDTAIAPLDVIFTPLTSSSPA